MKKTIAKLMAAAMLLSAVPAVTMPSFVSNAADSVTATTAAYAKDVFDTNPNATLKSPEQIFSNGVIKTVYFSKNVTGVKETVPTGNLAKVLNITATKLNNAPDADHVAYEYKASLKSTATSQEMSDFRQHLLKGTNTFGIQSTLAVNANSQAQADATWLDTFDVKVYGTDQYYFGGKVEAGNVIKTNVYDEAALLDSGDVYAKIGNISTTNKDERLIEVEILQGNKGQLKGNDALRGNTLNLDKVYINGNPFKVTKLGSQSLKEAHMKKLIAKNITQVGKGALRKCKNVRKVNISDKNKVRKIRSKAFYDCKNLKHINIDGRKLKEVGKDAFGKLKKNCVIKLKATKSKYNEDVKKIKKSGAKNVKYARIAP